MYGISAGIETFVFNHLIYGIAGYFLSRKCGVSIKLMGGYVSSTSMYGVIHS